MIAGAELRKRCGQGTEREPGDGGCRLWSVEAVEEDGEHSLGDTHVAGADLSRGNFGSQA